jgi:trehalose 6-phosphate phosphatase
MRLKSRNAQEKLRAIVDKPDGYAIFVGFDGTLLQPSEARRGVVVPSDLPETLESIKRGMTGALVVVTGRPLAEVDWLLQPYILSVIAEHGSEVRIDDTISTQAAPISSTMIQCAQGAVEHFRGVELEVKRYSIAVHYRRVPHLSHAIWRSLGTAMAAQGHRSRLLRGNFVQEILPVDASKRGAVERVLATPSFEGRKPIFIGYDSSDEEACLIAEEAGGAGLRVAGEYFRLSHSVFHGCSEVKDWVYDLADGLQCGGSG